MFTVPQPFEWGFLEVIVSLQKAIVNNELAILHKLAEAN